MKKKLVCIFTCLIVCFAAVSFTACGDENDGSVKIYVPDGATALALAYFMDGHEKVDGRETDITVVPSSSISTFVTGGQADLAVVPSNLAAKLYNANGKYKLMATLTHGNLYIVGDELGGIDGLKGKTVGVIGQGQVPDLVFRYILKNNGIDYEISDTAAEGKVALRYYADGGSVAKAYAAKQIEYGLLAEPAASTIHDKINSASRVDVQKLWKDAVGTEGFPQACLVVRSEFAENNKKFLDKFYEELESNDDWAVKHPESTVQAIEKNMQENAQSSVQSLTAEIAERCNVKAISAKDDRAAVEAYLSLFLDMESELGASLIGGKLPDDGFYM